MAGSQWPSKGTFPPKNMIRPDQLTLEQIRDYRNPLRRLIEMQVQSRELMGFSYISPWPRVDAQQGLKQT